MLGLHDRSEPDLRGATFRPAQATEREAAVRLLLGAPTAHASDQHIQDFLAYCHHRGIDLRLLWIADVGGSVALSVLPMISPGRTALLFTSSHAGGRGFEPAMAQLVEHVTRELAARDVQLAQVLLDPVPDTPIERALIAAGFALMAELHYMQCNLRSPFAAPVLPPHCRWQTYSPQAHELFAQTILATYRDSLDCPLLNGLRNIEDVIQGHKASGEFDPQRWFLLEQSGRAMGVLLLCNAARGDAVDLVYVGLTPEARGHKLGELLMKQALSVASNEKSRRLSLAVDSRNVPALKLYYRHGLQRVGAKLAMLKKLVAS